MSTMCLAAWETMKLRVGNYRSLGNNYRVWEMRGKIPGWHISGLIWPYFPRGYIVPNPIILIYDCYIWFLLIEANLNIYTCYIICKGGVEIFVLTVSDSEHDSEQAWETTTRRRRLPRSGKEKVTWLSKIHNQKSTFENQHLKIDIWNCEHSGDEGLYPRHCRHDLAGRSFHH